MSIYYLGRHFKIYFSLQKLRIILWMFYCNTIIFRNWYSSKMCVFYSSDHSRGHSHGNGKFPIVICRCHVASVQTVLICASLMVEQSTKCYQSKDFLYHSECASNSPTYLTHTHCALYLIYSNFAFTPRLLRLQYCSSLVSRFVCQGK